MSSPFQSQDVTSSFDKTDIENSKLMAILSYVGPLVLIPLFVARGSKFTMFHAKQGLVLAIAEVILSFLLWILGGIPIIGAIFGFVGGLISAVLLVLSIIGIVNVVTGKAKKLPLIGNFVLPH